MDLEALLPLPAVPYDASDKHVSRVSSLSLVRYRTNDYSVPVAYGHMEVVVRGYVGEVVISCGAEVIARHRRSYERDDFVFDPVHYLPLLERKTGALDQAAPLAGWELPEEFGVLRRLLESRMGRRGKREFVQVLRLMESFRKEEVYEGVRDALRLGAISFVRTWRLWCEAIKPLHRRYNTNCSTRATCRCWSARQERWTRLQSGGLMESFRKEEVYEGVRDALRLLRRRQAPGAVQSGGSSPETRPTAVSLSAQGQRDQDSSQGLHGAHAGERAVNERSTVLLEHHLKELKLPTFLREYGKVASQCAAEDVDHPGYLQRLSELELIDRHHRMVDRRIKAARFPAAKSLDTFDFLAIPSVNKHLVMQLARCEYVDRRENVIAVGNSGTGKTHVALGLGLAACQRGLSVAFTTAASLVHELIEARDERRLLNLQKKLARLKLLIIDELGFVPLSKTGADLLFEVFSQRYERGSILVTTNLPFDEWTEVFGSERLTGALLDRLTHRVHILEMNGESYRLKQSRQAEAVRARLLRP